MLLNRIEHLNKAKKKQAEIVKTGKDGISEKIGDVRTKISSHDTTRQSQWKRDILGGRKKRNRRDSNACADCTTTHSGEHP